MQISKSPLIHYQRIGGEEMVRALVRQFYQLMDELPEAYGIRKLHAEDLQGATDKLFKRVPVQKFFGFLSGCMGGPHNQPLGHRLLVA